MKKSRFNVYGALERRLQKMVRHMKEEEERMKPLGLCAPKEISRSPFQSFSKCFLTVMISILFFYQAYDRITYYLSEPITVDVFFLKIKQTGGVTLCYSETEALVQLKRKYSIQSIASDSLHCGFKTTEAFLSSNLTSLEFWTMQNASTIMKYKGNASYFQKETYHPFGLCSTLEVEKEEMNNLKISVDVYNVPGSCPAMHFAYVHSKGEAITSQTTFLLPHGNKITVHFIPRNYKFLSTTKNPCTSAEYFKQCFINCANKIQADRYGCRVPYLTMDEKFPWCTSAMNFTKELFINMQYMLFEINRKKDCNCARRCDEITFISEVTIEKLQATDLSAKYFISFSESEEAVLIERYQYDLISLIIDIGGIIGLYFGYSILNIAHFGHDLFSCLSFFGHSKKYTRHDPIFRKVKRYFDFEHRRKERKDAFDLRKCVKEIRLCSRCKRLPKTLVILFSASLCFYGFYFSVRQYFSYPIIKTVEIQDVDIMSYPDIIICADSLSLLREKNKLIRKRVEDACEMELVDFVSQSKTPRILWQKSAKTGYLSRELTRILKESQIKVSNFSSDMLSTPFGYCTRIKIVSYPYLGPFLSAWLGFLAFSPICNDKARKMFFEDPITGIDFNNGVDLPQNATLSISLKNMKIDRVNTPNRPCVEEDEAKSCKMRCIQKTLRKKIPCSMPYMNGIDNTTAPECNSTNSAKESQKIYLKLFTEFQFNKDCECTPPCTTKIVDVHVYVSTAWSKNMDIMVVSSRDNVIELYKEENAFGVVALLCNVGNYLGLTLGISVLSMGYSGIRNCALFCHFKNS